MHTENVSESRPQNPDGVAEITLCGSSSGHAGVDSQQPGRLDHRGQHH